MRKYLIITSLLFFTNFSWANCVFSSSDLKFVSTTSSNELKTHLFCLEVDFITFKNIIKNQTEATHFLTEVSLFGVHFINYAHRLSFDNFMKNHFPVTVKTQIKDLIKFLNWDKKYNIPVN